MLYMLVMRVRGMLKLRLVFLLLQLVEWDWGVC
jgi:hypothetical protein